MALFSSKKKTAGLFCVAAGVLAALPLLVGCDTAQQREENARLKRAVDALRQETARLQRGVDAGQQERIRLKARVADLNRTLRELEAARAAGEDPRTKALAQAATAPATGRSQTVSTTPDP